MFDYYKPTTNWIKSVEPVRRNDTVFDCFARGTNASGSAQSGNIGVISRRGDSCQPGAEYDSAAGVCKEPPKECEVGTPNLFRSSSYPIIVINGKNTVPSSPPSGCLNGCAYEADSSRPQKCFRLPGSETEGFCNYLLKTNGQSCSADSGNLGATGPSLDDPSTPDPDPNPDPNDPGCPKGYSWSGTTCVKTPTDSTDPTDPKDPGGDGGGTGGGGTGGGGDGGTGGGDGGTGGDGGGDGNGGTAGGDGDGGGTGGGGGDKPGEECKPGESCNGSTDGGNTECDKPIACDGDPFQCAILKQAHKDSCDLRKLPTDKEKKDLQDLIDQQQKKIDAEQQALDSKVDGLFSDFKQTASGSSAQGQCLTDVQFDVLGSSFTLPFSQVCEFLHLFRFAVIAMAYLAAARIVSRGF
ncbi:TPA: attachment protein [Pseudomonas aeruginosa]|nr:attachment protein [Pseudomonas aeruginosa]